MNPKVLGFVMARDEWPVLGISVLNALKRGVDHIVVVNHASIDNTAEGLALLSNLYPGRLTVFDMPDGSVYLQEASISLALGHFDTSGFDWVYVFDADEILITTPGLTLPQVLSHAPEGTDVARYHIDQWVWPREFDQDSPESYLEVKTMALPTVFLDLSPELKVFELRNGSLNYFDIPFPSKLIVRPGHVPRLLAGAHQVLGIAEEFLLDSSRCFVAHLPIRSLKQLENKARQGKLLLEKGFSRHHGWQNQVLSEIRKETGLDGYWLRHSVDGTGVQNQMASGHPKTKPDMRLREAINDVVKQLSAELDRRASKASREKGAGVNRSLDSLPTTVALDSIHQRNIQRDDALREKGLALQQRDRALAELNSTRIELSLANEAISAIQDTRSWRWTSVLRRFFGRK